MNLDNHMIADHYKKVSHHVHQPHDLRIFYKKLRAKCHHKKLVDRRRFFLEENRAMNLGIFFVSLDMSISILACKE